MRLNVYSQELILGNDPTDVLMDRDGMPTTEVEEKVSNTGLIYTAVRLFIRSPKEIHQEPNDDDRSAIAFWLPKSPEKRECFAQQLELLARLVRNARPETGLD
ncbi:Uncharacterised protein [Mycobacteroides abscessus subsp. massiliense]|uniref:hypothetical protein n=1 Tax=Mycobacteroides abscessus TaxID=36809 RepID=UPI00092AF74F|nr:hypothetical protein [Mycobacteroides abscessus]SHV31488.1 Uncharacterised protein [Mycobacteroides abscessus subsp. abscessus]SKG32346.1 Uncharacterised protein [Mycobacteroides abscessus subsp. massiliense]SKH69796.1 Uncharacterised protein [Mycobacteroides abscessus subsp. massiliense]SKJ13228.1 Uncharacterised protein [Mycobacteroides abscessus subsp. massiliense]SKK57332.1 Uncharacterised protein [Mycobacteroides abscessus subsp. massiliense]